MEAVRTARLQIGMATSPNRSPMAAVVMATPVDASRGSPHQVNNEGVGLGGGGGGGANKRSRDGRITCVRGGRMEGNK